MTTDLGWLWHALVALVMAGVVLALYWAGVSDVRPLALAFALALPLREFWQHPGRSFLKPHVVGEWLPGLIIVLTADLIGSKVF